VSRWNDATAAAPAALTIRDPTRKNRGQTVGPPV